MRVRITDRCKVWEINDLDRRAEVKFSCSRKIKEDSSYDKVQAEHGVAKNGYIPTYFSFVKFVGHAYNKLKDVNIGDTITEMDATIEYEPYWDSNNECVNYPKNPKITVFDFEIYSPDASNNYNSSLDAAPQVADTPESSAHNYNEPTTYDMPQNNSSADDECPF